MKEMKQSRSNISYQLSQEDTRQLAIQQEKNERGERDRLQRLQHHDEQSEDMYNRVHQLLLRK